MNLFKIPLNLTYHESLPFLGMNKEPSPQEKELIEHYLIKIKQLTQPIGTWKTFAVKARESARIHLAETPLQIVGSSTSEHFQSCEQITLLAATLGAEIDQLLSRLSSENPAHALIADAVASSAIEFFTEQFDLYLSTQIRHKGFFPTARFSPGYGNWPLNWQKEFLSSVKGEKIGLTTTDYFILKPTKSITAAIGWSKLPTKKTRKPCREQQTCRSCRLATSCPGRFVSN